MFSNISCTGPRLGHLAGYLIVRFDKLTTILAVYIRYDAKPLKGVSIYRTHLHKQSVQ